MADLTVGSGKTYATFALAFAAAGNGDNIIAFATGAALTTFSETSVNITQTNLTIKVNPGDEGLIKVVPAGNYTDLWDFYGGGCKVYDILFHSNGTGTYYLIGLRALADWTATRCIFYPRDNADGCGIHTYGAVTGFMVTECEFHFDGSTLRTHGIEATYITNGLIERSLFTGGTRDSIGVRSMRSGVYFINNIVQNAYYGVEVDSSATGLGILCNTFYDCIMGIRFSGTDLTGPIANNTFSSSNYGISKSAAGGTQTAPTNNHFYNNIADTQNYEAPVNSASGDPQFTTPGSDFTWPAGSPLQDAGADLTGTVTNDYVETPRPQGAGWDIGAYELVVAAGPSCLYVPDGYTIIPDAVFYPGNVIVEGEDDPTAGMDAATKGLVDLACNSNYLHKRVTKTYVYQDLTSDADAGHIEYDEAVDGLSLLLGTWYVPALLDGQGFKATIRCKTSSAADTRIEVEIHDADRSALIDTTLAIASTSWTDIVLEFTAAEIQAFKDTAGVDAPFFIDLWAVYLDFGTHAQVKCFTVESTDDGSNELTSGVRGDGHIPQCWQRWNAQSPLPVDRMDQLQDNLDAFREEKLSTFAAFSDFGADKAAAVYVSPTESADWQTVAVIPVPYMPGVSSLGFAVTGFYNQADDRFRLLSDYQKDSGILPSAVSFDDPIGTWDPTDPTQWETGTVAVKEETGGKMGWATVYVQMLSPTTRGQAMMGLTLWEVY